VKNPRALLSHAGIFIVGFAMVGLWTHASLAGRQASSAQRGNDEEQTATNLSSSASSVRAPRPASGDDLATIKAAWAQLPSRHLKQLERVKVQEELLRRWAERDLEGALLAALSEPCKNSDPTDPFGESDHPEFLEKPFGDAIRDRPQKFWELIRDRRLGTFGTEMVFDFWAKNLANTSPDLLISYLPEIKGTQLDKAITEFSNSYSYDTELARKLWQQLSQRSDWEASNAHTLEKIAPMIATSYSEDEIRSMIQTAKGPLLAAAYLSLGQKLLKSEEPVDFSSEIQAVPENLRFDFAVSLLSPNPYITRPAKEDELLRLAMDQALTTQDHTERADQINKLLERTGPPSVTISAIGMEPQPETLEIFHAGITPLIQNVRSEAWEWISKLENPVWKDRAYAEYAMQSLDYYKDPAGAATALEQIQDPAIKAEVLQRKQNWEKNNSQK
jgi:hypothetical protein